MDLKSVLAEAQFALGMEALYNSDTTLALEHFSQVNTPQAAWNQVQVCAWGHFHSTESLHGMRFRYMHGNIFMEPVQYL